MTTLRNRDSHELGGNFFDYQDDEVYHAGRADAHVNITFRLSDSLVSNCLGSYAG